MSLMSNEFNELKKPNELYVLKMTSEFNEPYEINEINELNQINELKVLNEPNGPNESNEPY